MSVEARVNALAAGIGADVRQIFENTYAPAYPLVSASGLTLASDWQQYRLNNDKYFDLGEIGTGNERNELVPVMNYAFIKQLNNDSIWIWDKTKPELDPVNKPGNYWQRSVDDVIPIDIGGNPLIDPASSTNDFGHRYSDWNNVGFFENRKIDLEIFGGSPEATAAVNDEAMANMIRVAKTFGHAIEGRFAAYTFSQDIQLDWDRCNLQAAGMQWILDGCKIVFKGDSDDGLWAVKVVDLWVERIGTPGAAFLITGTQEQRFPNRWHIESVFINGSTGDGFQIRGSFTGVLTNVTARLCQGAGIHMLINSDGQLGANAITVVGGDIQNNLMGAVLSDTKSVEFKNTVIQGNKQVGVWLRGDNRNFRYDGGYLEGNAKDFLFIPQYNEITDSWTLTTVEPHENYVCDVRVGDPLWAGDPNAIVLFSDLWDSAGGTGGGNGGTHHSCIEGLQILIIHQRINFWSFAGAPIRPHEEVDSPASGYALDCHRSSGSLTASSGNQMYRNPPANLKTIRMLDLV